MEPLYVLGECLKGERNEVGAGTRAGRRDGRVGAVVWWTDVVVSEKV